MRSCASCLWNFYYAAVCTNAHMHFCCRFYVCLSLRVYALICIAESRLKIHIPQINTMSLSRCHGPARPPSACVAVCVFMCVNVYVSHFAHGLNNRCHHIVHAVLFNVLYGTLRTPTLPVYLSCICYWHTTLWLICGTIQSWPLTQASSALHPPTGCQCLKWRGLWHHGVGDTMLRCVLLLRHAPDACFTPLDARQWEGPCRGSCCLVAVYHHTISGSDIVPVCVHVL